MVHGVFIGGARCGSTVDRNIKSGGGVYIGGTRGGV